MIRPIAAPSPAMPPAATAPDANPYDPSVVAARLEAGRRAETTAGDPDTDIVAKTPPTYFRTYEQLKRAMFDLQQRFPDLVEVRDLGDTSEKVAGAADRDVLALVLRNKSVTGALPSTMHVGGIHAREIANPELLMTFAQGLLDGYGRDADATMLLNSRETVLVPMLNADGHAMVERGYTGEKNGELLHRKSTAYGDGVDLNRNFEFHWGGPGASSFPRSETYRGPSAGSEPETQAVERFVHEHKPNLFIDWHSYSRLNMFPWGDTKEHTPDHAGFEALAKKFTTYNGYSPIQSIQLYPTTGTTDDHAYGADGVPSMAIETGSSFLQSDEEFARTLRENLPVLTYATKVADAPLTRVFGPDTAGVAVDTATHAVSATISDANNGGQVLAGAELVLDPLAAPGTGVALTAADGVFDGVQEQVVGTTAAASADAAAGAMVYVRGRDSAGNWGPLTAQWIAGHGTR